MHEFLTRTEKSIKSVTTENKPKSYDDPNGE